MADDHAQNGTKAPRWRKPLVVGLIALLLLSVIARVMVGKEEAPATPEGAAAFVAGDSDAEPEKAPTTMEKALPFVTESALAMLLGLVLGMATRMVVKLLVLGLVVFFVVLQYLAFKGVVAVDWSALGIWLRDFVMNVGGSEGVGSFVKHKLPAAGSLLTGYYLGLRRG